MCAEASRMGTGVLRRNARLSPIATGPSTTTRLRPATPSKPLPWSVADQDERHRGQHAERGRKSLAVATGLSLRETRYRKVEPPDYADSAS